MRAYVSPALADARSGKAMPFTTLTGPRPRRGIRRASGTSTLAVAGGPPDAKGGRSTGRRRDWLDLVDPPPSAPESTSRRSPDARACLRFVAGPSRHADDRRAQHALPRGHLEAGRDPRRRVARGAPGSPRRHPRHRSVFDCSAPIGQPAGPPCSADFADSDPPLILKRSRWGLPLHGECGQARGPSVRSEGPSVSRMLGGYGKKAERVVTGRSRRDDPWTWRDTSRSGRRSTGARR